MLRPPGAWRWTVAATRVKTVLARPELEHMLAAAEHDRTNDVRATVQPNLLADVRQPFERQPAGGDELAVVVGAIHAGDHQRPVNLTRSLQRSHRWNRSIRKNGRRRRGSL